MESGKICRVVDAAGRVTQWILYTLWSLNKNKLCCSKLKSAETNRYDYTQKQK